VPRKALILDPSQFNLDNVAADIEEIRENNPQRYEMEQLTAVCYHDIDKHVIVGYKDVTEDEFWVRGHMPGMPLMPGVIMCEAAAQLASFHTRKNKLMEGLVGFGALSDVRFRGVVRPGDRFVIVVRMLKAKRLMISAEFQCFVGEEIVCEGELKGIPLPVDMLTSEEDK